MAELKKLIADPFDKQSCLHALSLIPAFPVAVIDKVYAPLRIEIVDGALSVDDSKHFKSLLKSLLLMSGAAPGSLAAKDRQALTSLRITWASPYTDIVLNPLSGLTSLTLLAISECQSWDNKGLLTDLSPLSSLKSLTSLGLTNCKSLTELNPLAVLTSLTTLNLEKCNLLTDLGPLSGLTSLTTLNLGECQVLTDVSPLSGLTSLTTLVIKFCESLTDLSPLAGLTSVISLTIIESTSFRGKGLLTDLSPFKGLTSLTELVIAWKGVTDLSPLSGLTSLTSLDLSNCESLKDLSPISCLKSLITLSLWNCVCITDLSPLSGLTFLTRLDLSNCQVLTDVRPLSDLTSLKSLHLFDCESLTDLSPLCNLIPNIDIKPDRGFRKGYVDDDLLNGLLAEQKANLMKHEASLKPTAKMLEAIIDSTKEDCRMRDRLVASDDLIAHIRKFPADIIDKVYSMRTGDNGFDNWKNFLLQAGAVEGSIAKLSKLHFGPPYDGKSLRATDICGRFLKIWHVPNLVPLWFRDIDKFNADDRYALDIDIINPASLIRSFSNLSSLVIPRRWINRPPSFDLIAESSLHHVSLELDRAPLTERAIRELSKLRNLKKITLKEPRISCIKSDIETLIHVIPSLKNLEICSRFLEIEHGDFELSGIQCLDSIETLLIQLPSVRLNSLLPFGKLRSLKLSAQKLLLGDDCRSHLLEELSISDHGTGQNRNSRCIWLSPGGASSFDYVKAFPNLVTLSIESSHFDKTELISGFTHLKTLKLIDVKRLNDFSHLLLNSSLGSFSIIRSSDYFADRISVLAKLRELKSLDVSENKHLTNLDFVASFHDLEILTANDCENLSTIDGLRTLTQLKVFSANDCRKLSNIEALRGLTKLIELYLYGADEVKSLQPLADLINLEIVDLGLYLTRPERSGYEILRNLVNLKKLNLAHNYDLNDASIDFLNDLRSLISLDLSNISINSILGILNLPHLSNLNVSHFRGDKSELFHRPEVRIVPPNIS